MDRGVWIVCGPGALSIPCILTRTHIEMKLNKGNVPIIFQCIYIVE